MLYRLKEDKNYEKVKRTSLANIGWKEKNLEDLLSKNINDLIYSNDLMTIFTQRIWQEEPDILALDITGDLYIFELKRWTSNPENLLQVLRYGQLYGGSNYDELNELYKKHHVGAGTLLEAHKKHFDLTESSQLKPSDFNKQQHFVVVTNGVDQETIEAISYWKNNGLNLDAITYWIYQIENEYFIEFDMYSPVEGFLAYENNAYVLNTNHSNDSNCTADMLNNHKAAAYSSGWMEKIDKIQKGDFVFLYQSGVGIVAYGIADGIVRVGNYCGGENNEHYMNLEPFHKLEKPMSPSEMKNIGKKGFPFLQTMYSISEEVQKAFVADIEKNRL